MKTLLKTHSKVVLFTLGLVFALMFFCLSIFFLPETAWYQRIVSSRLNTRTVNNLCQKFELPNSHDLCDQRGAVYTYDYYIFIEEKLGNAESRYEDFEHYLGDYNTWEHILPSSTNVLYDLAGDRNYIIHVRFSEDGNLRSLIALRED